MLQIIKNPRERQRVIRQFNTVLKSDMQLFGPRTVGSRGGHDTYKVYSHGDGKLWAVPSLTASEGTPRSWAPMGIFDPGRSALDITIEINIAHEVDGRAAGVIARESDTDEYYILHDGGVSGGRKGVGRDFFLAHSHWSMSNLTSIYDGEKPEKMAVLLGPIVSGLTSRIETYVLEAFNFKLWATTQGEKLASPIIEAVNSVKLLTGEFAGKRHNKGSKEREYAVMHGYIVKSLIEQRTSIKQDCEDVYRTAMIDALVDVKGRYTEIYEVKPSADRTELYKAIGQLMVHGAPTHMQS